MLVPALIATLGIYALRINDIVGVMVDDAWYALLGRSLAEGTGYAVISSPHEPLLPLYPPGFPAILSAVFRVAPEFPQNVLFLKAVSVAAMMAVGLLTFVYLRDDRRQSPGMAGTIAVATALVPAFVFLATSTLMSECVFTLTQIASVVLAQRSTGPSAPRRGSWFAVCAGIVAAAAVLIRSAAAGLVVAITGWMLLEKRYRHAALFAATVCLVVLPWLAYARAHAPTAEQRAQHGGAIAYDYAEQFWMRMAGSAAAGEVRASAIPARIWANLTDVFGRAMGGIFLPAFLHAPNESGEEVIGVGPGSMGDNHAMLAISLTLSVIVVIGFIAMVRRRPTAAEFLVPISLGITVLWPFWTFRFVLPLAPFLFLYLVTGLQVLTRSDRVARMTLLCVIGLYVYDHAGYIVDARTNAGRGRIEWVDRATAVDAALDWVRDNLAEDGTIASTNPALLYLRTGLRSVSYENPMLPMDAWKARGIRYVVSLHPLELPAARMGPYTVLYKSDARLWVIEL